jgi:hypothetical protein
MRACTEAELSASKLNSCRRQPRAENRLRSFACSRNARKRHRHRRPETARVLRHHPASERLTIINNVLDVAGLTQAPNNTC